MNKKNSLEGNLSFKECGESLKLMKNVKSPGSDGFTVDFYKFFWNDLNSALSHREDEYFHP
jgi:hypothetical protein